MQHTHTPHTEQPIGFGRHDCLPFPPLGCLDEAEIDGGYWVGKYFALQIGDALVLYDDGGMPTDLTPAEAIALDRLENAGSTHSQVNEFLAQMRHALSSEQRARDAMEQAPLTPRTIEQRTAWAWHIHLLKLQGDALAALLARIAETVKASFSGASDKIEASTAAPPPRAAARVGARAIASITLVPRILAQRPIDGPRHAGRAC